MLTRRQTRAVARSEASADKPEIPAIICHTGARANRSGEVQEAREHDVPLCSNGSDKSGGRGGGEGGGEGDDEGGGDGSVSDCSNQTRVSRELE